MLVLSTVVAAPAPPPALPAAAGRRAGGSGGDAPPASESANSSGRLLPMPAPPPLPPPPRIIVSRPQDGGPLGGPFHFVDTVFRAARPGGAGGGGGGLLPPPLPPHLPALPPPPPLLAGLATLLLNRTFAGPPGLPLEVFDVGSDEEPAGVCERLRAANPGKEKKKRGTREKGGARGEKGGARALSPSHTRPPSLSPLFLSSQDITACEPDSRVTLDANAAERAGRPSSAPSPTPDDPRFGEQWNLRAIRVPPAWAATGDLGTAAVRVCVVDTGVDVAHPDLAANIAVNPGEAAGRLLAAAARRAGKKDAPGGSPPAALLAPDGTDGDGNGIPDDIHGAAFLNGAASGDVTDDNGHGTFVAGVIGAVGNNALGIAGINQVSALIPCKFMDAGGGGWVSDAIRCWEYCLSRGAHVISNSWGGGAASAALRVGVAHAAERGVLLVTSAGNDAADTDATPHFPSTLPDDIILSVAASTQAGTLWPKSNYGQRSVDVAAPGEKVLSTGPGGGFITLSGTSMATPHAAGAAALVLQQFARLGWDLDTVPPAVGLGLQAKRALIKTARPLAAPPGMAKAPPLAGGLLDVAAALAAVPRPPASAAKAAPTLGSDPASLAAAVARPAGDTVFYSTPDGAVIGASELSEPGPRSRTAGAPYTGALANVLSGSGGNLPTPVNGGGGWRSPAEAAAAVAAAGAAPVAAAAAIPPGAATAPGPGAAAAAGSNAAGVRSGGEGTTTAAPVNPDAGDAVAEPDPSSTPPRFTPPPRPGSLVGWRIRAGRFAGAEEPGPVPATPLRPPGPTLVPRPGLTDEAPPGGLPALPGLVAGAPALAPGDPLAPLVNPPPAEGGGDGEGGDGGGDGDGDDADAASSSSSLAPAFGGGGVVSEEEEEEEGEPGGEGAPPVITSFAQKHSGSGDGKKGKEDRPPATPKPPRPPRPTRPPKLPPPPPPSPEERAAAKADKKADARAHKAAKLEAKIEERVGPAGAAAAIAAAQAARGLPTPPPTLVADGLTRTWADAPAGGMAAAAPGPGGSRGGLTQTWAPAPPGGVARPPPGAPAPSSDNTAARPRIIPAAGQAPPVYLPLPGAPPGTYYYYENHDGDEGTPPRAVIFTDHDGDAGTAPLPLATPPPELVARVPPVNRVGAGNGWGWGGANTIGNELIDAEVYGGTQGSSFVPVGYAGVRASAPAPAGGSAATTWAPAPPAAPVPGGTTWAPAVGGAVGAAGGQAAAPTPRAGAPARAPASSPKPTRPPRTPVPRPTLSPEAQAAKASARAARDAVAAARGEVRGGKAALRAADREGRDAVNAAIDAAHADMHPVRPCLPGIEEPGGRGKKACVVRGVDKPTGTLFVPAPPQSPGGAAAPAGAPPALVPAPTAPTTTMATPAGGGGGGVPATTAIPGQPDSDASRRDAADAAASLTDEGAGSSAAAAAAVDTSAAAGIQADMYAGSVSESAAPDAQLFVSPADAVAGVGPAVAPGAGTLWADAPPGGVPPPPPAAASWAPASPEGDGLAAPPPPSAPGVTDTWAPAGPDGSGSAASSPPPPASGWAPAVEPGAAGAAGASSAPTTWAPAVDATANATNASAAGPLPFASPRPADGLSRPGPGGLPPLFAGGGAAGGAGAALPGTAAATANLAYPGTSTRGGALGGSYAPVGPGSALGAGAAAAAAAPPPPPPPGAGVLVSTGPVTGSAGDDAETRGAIPDEPEPDPDSWDPADVAAAGGASAFPGAEVVAALPEAAAKLSQAAAEATSAAALEGRLAAKEGAGPADPAAAAAAAGLPARPWELVPDEAEARASIEAAAKGRVGAGAPAPALSPRRAGPPAPAP